NEQLSRVCLPRSASAGGRGRSRDRWLGDGWPVRLCRVQEYVRAVAVVVPHPRHRERQTSLITTLRHKIEQGVCADQCLATPRVRGVGVEDVLVIRLGENTDARRLSAGELLPPEVVLDLSACEFVCCERHVVVEVEVVAGR